MRFLILLELALVSDDTPKTFVCLQGSLSSASLVPAYFLRPSLLPAYSLHPSPG